MVTGEITEVAPSCRKQFWFFNGGIDEMIEFLDIKGFFQFSVKAEFLYQALTNNTNQAATECFCMNAHVF